MKRTFRDYPNLNSAQIGNGSGGLRSASGSPPPGR